MLDLLWKRHSQAGLQMLFHNISPLGGQAQPRIFSQQFLREAKAQGHLHSRMNDGFQNPVQARLRRDLKAQRQLGLPKQSPAFLQLSVQIRVIVGSKK
jgi:hypothetical protein